MDIELTRTYAGKQQSCRVQVVENQLSSDQLGDLAKACFNQDAYAYLRFIQGACIPTKAASHGDFGIS